MPYLFLPGSLPSVDVRDWRFEMLDLFFYFTTETGTQGLVKELESMGMNVSVRPPEPNLDLPEWAVLASGAAQRDWDRYEAMAARHGGKFDGWGAAV